jgi:hypothetical protein
VTFLPSTVSVTSAIFERETHKNSGSSSFYESKRQQCPNESQKHSQGKQANAHAEDPRLRRLSPSGVELAGSPQHQKNDPVEQQRRWRD